MWKGKLWKLSALWLIKPFTQYRVQLCKKSFKSIYRNQLLKLTKPSGAAGWGSDGSTTPYNMGFESGGYHVGDHKD